MSEQRVEVFQKNVRAAIQAEIDKGWRVVGLATIDTSALVVFEREVWDEPAKGGKKR